MYLCGADVALEPIHTSYMENQIVKVFEISIGDFAYGWEDIKLRFDNTTISFMASYMLRDEPMSTLITSIAVLENKE